MTHNFIMKIPNKREFQQIVLNHLSDFERKDSVKLFKGYTKESFQFLVNDTTLLLDNTLRKTEQFLTKAKLDTI